MVQGIRGRSYNGKYIECVRFAAIFAVFPRQTHLLCRKTCLHILAMTSLFAVAIIDAEEAFGSSDRFDG